MQTLLALSIAMLAGLAGLRRFIGIDFEIVAICLDPQFGGEPNDYSEIESLCEKLNVKLDLRRTHIGEVIFEDRGIIMKEQVILRPVTGEEYGTVRKLAETIWPECYKDILSTEQIRYMLDMMYSEDAIADDVSEKIRYRFVMDDTEIAGFSRAILKRSFLPSALLKSRA